MLIIVRTAPFPNCRYCGSMVPYWIPGQPDSEASHDECKIRHMVDDVIAEIKAEKHAPDRQ